MIIDGTSAYIMTSNFSRSALGGSIGSSGYRNREYGIIDTTQQDVLATEAIFVADWNRSTVQFNDPNLVVSPINSRNDFTTLINSARSTLLIEAEEMNDSDIEQALDRAHQKFPMLFNRLVKSARRLSESELRTRILSRAPKGKL